MSLQHSRRLKGEGYIIALLVNHILKLNMEPIQSVFSHFFQGLAPLSSMPFIRGIFPFISFLVIFAPAIYCVRFFASKDGVLIFKMLACISNAAAIVILFVIFMRFHLSFPNEFIRNLDFLLLDTLFKDISPIKAFGDGMMILHFVFL